MGTIVEKIQDLEYNELLTLGVVEKNQDLTDILRSEINMPFNLLYKFQKTGELNTETKDLLVLIFEKLILTKQDLINQYLRLGGMEPTQSKVIEEPLEEIEGFEEIPSHIEGHGAYYDQLEDNNNLSVKEVEKLVGPEVVKAVAEIIKPKKVEKTKTLSEKEIPRRYGKQQILTDIEKQGFKATSLQRAMLSLNDLKNIYANISAKCIKDYFSEEDLKQLTEEDLRNISATITLLDRKLNSIVKKKKPNVKS